ncbi:hypothetical protein [Paraburkholderia bonniea]|uniref:hypothetical protein n=1 Tax=Paraburkholderia bonniea TaxID=2152891 RepID=UPI0012909A6B|nr:hypothetical protein [Paraburkholderia bonniea]
MPILVLLMVAAALVYGAVQAFAAISWWFGSGVAVAAALLVLGLLLAGLTWLWQRQREIAPNVRDGDWTHRLSAPWGEISLAAGKRLCKVQLNDARGAYIFADLQEATVEHGGQGWQVMLQVHDAARTVWRLPMSGKRQAHQWQRILTLAMAQRL